jgi:hypothetical protein
MTDSPHWKHNPWGLTEGEVRALAAVIERGSAKGAASALCRSLDTVNVHCERARKKMAERDPLVWGSRVRYLILFDRWQRATLETKP